MIYPYNRETGDFNHFDETNIKKRVFCPFKTERVKMSNIKLPRF